MEDAFPDEHLFSISIQSPWFLDIANYLVIGRCPYFSSKYQKRLIRESSKFEWINGFLFKKCPNHVMRRYVQEIDVYDILKACHDEPGVGNYSTVRTLHKILGVGYFWPTMTKDVAHYINNFE